MDETLAMRIGAIRRLFTTEGSLFRDHLLRLDAAGRRDRFMGSVGDEFLVRYATECFASKSLVLGFFEQDTLRAAGELHAPDDDLTSDIVQCRTGIPKSRDRHGHAEAVDPFSSEPADSTLADELPRAKSGDAGACAQIQG